MRIYLLRGNRLLIYEASGRNGHLMVSFIGVGRQLQCPWSCPLIFRRNGMSADGDSGNVDGNLDEQGGCSQKWPPKWHALNPIIQISQLGLINLVLRKILDPFKLLFSLWFPLLTFPKGYLFSATPDWNLFHRLALAAVWRGVR